MYCIPILCQSASPGTTHEPDVIPGKREVVVGSSFYRGCKFYSPKEKACPPRRRGWVGLEGASLKVGDRLFLWASRDCVPLWRLVQHRGGYYGDDTNEDGFRDEYLGLGEFLHIRATDDCKTRELDLSDCDCFPVLPQGYISTSKARPQWLQGYRQVRSLAIVQFLAVNYALPANPRVAVAPIPVGLLAPHRFPPSRTVEEGTPLCLALLKSIRDHRGTEP